MDNDSKKGSSSNALATLGQTISTILEGIVLPVEVTKNLYKTLDRFCTAVVDVPISRIEGVTVETRALNDARKKLISTNADLIAEQIQVDPEYARVAVRKYSERILREQVNLDRVCEVAVNEIRNEAHHAIAAAAESPGDGTQQRTAPEVQPISEEFLNQFEPEASRASTEEMQLLFGRILAGEIQSPSSFSIRTVKLLSQLDNETARLFHRLCSLCISRRLGNKLWDARVVALHGNASRNGLERYGLGFNQLNILNEYGLIISDFNSYMEYGAAIASEERIVIMPFFFQGEPWGLASTKGKYGPYELKLSGVALSTAGKELSRIVEVVKDETYEMELRKYFETQDLIVIPISNKDQINRPR